MKARVVIGANLGDEGKGTVVANYTKNANGKVLNVLTNGGAQRAHSILTRDGNFTFQHFGSGTYHGADNYYSCYFILNPMQFAEEHCAQYAGSKLYRDKSCRWSTPYDMMVNLIMEELRGNSKHGSCGMGIWNTVSRYNNQKYAVTMPFDAFMALPYINKVKFLEDVRNFYTPFIRISSKWKDLWFANGIIAHFIDDCQYLYDNTTVCPLSDLELLYDEFIFENGQGLMLNDPGYDCPGTTPSKTGMEYAQRLLKSLHAESVNLHYVTRPYLTRHGNGELQSESIRSSISSGISEDRTNHYNESQGEFRFASLDIADLQKRIVTDCGNNNFTLEITHCDEMDRVAEFKKIFSSINTYDNPLI